MDKSDYAPPAMRKLRVYAFDPQASTQMDTVRINHATIELPWEQRWEPDILPGPVNEYLEVIDVDPTSGQFYKPVNLNDPHVLAQDGIAPSEGDPRFHQQMVFAVAMKTIKLFERALGRKVFWSPRAIEDKRTKKLTYGYVRRLRIYPHALREANAYYSPAKKALLFGYFKASLSNAGVNLPGGWIFTALSHDIVAHETTHAILDGLHRRYIESSSVDSLAFHEAFADIVALLMHFTLPEVVSSQLAARRGDLTERSWLSGLARQFGEASGRYSALRDAIDEKGKDGLPDPTRLAQLSEPHERGAILVAAVFDAFITIYEQRTTDLFRLAGHDKASTANLSTELIARLTREAVKAADHVLRMCIRALDYLPPVDVHFGEFLRAIVTADNDLVPDDRMHYRLAVIQAFRRRGIFPDKCLSLAPDSLLWESLKGYQTEELSLTADDLLAFQAPPKSNWPGGSLDLTPQYLRGNAFLQSEHNRQVVWNWLMEESDHDAEWEKVLGIFFMAHPDATKKQGALFVGWDSVQPAVEVHSVRTCRRAGPDGQDLRQLVVEITQRRRGYFDSAQQLKEDQQAPRKDDRRSYDFTFRGGATLIIDLRDGTLRYVIRKRIDDDERLDAQRRFLQTGNDSLAMTYREPRADDNPFAMTHRGV
ncbi:hypothetical protein LOY55_11650 [Pseudomonas sp. B21-040]|uniref:hypothetical protein n=1 Tax=unclassified Pseudomonas TaxID=196821 RepID=UPI001CBB8661|nr:MULTISPECIES: hypothetical protein [unclassified Pseudomonas]UVL42705.1 hypothetical protein LOY55_11650 [Pseudomonas sp. B21-040]